MRKYAIGPYVPEWVKNPPEIYNGNHRKMHIYGQIYDWVRALKEKDKSLESTLKLSEQGIFFSLVCPSIHRNYKTQGIAEFWQYLDSQFEVKEIPKKIDERNIHPKHEEALRAITWLQHFIMEISHSFNRFKYTDDIGEYNYASLSKGRDKEREKIINLLKNAKTSINQASNLMEHYKIDLLLKWNTSLEENNSYRTRTVSNHFALKEISNLVNELEQRLTAIDHKYGNQKQPEDLVFVNLCAHIKPLLETININSSNKITCLLAHIIMYPERTAILDAIDHQKVKEGIRKAKKIYSRDKTSEDWL